MSAVFQQRDINVFALVLFHLHHVQVTQVQLIKQSLSSRLAMSVVPEQA